MDWTPEKLRETACHWPARILQTAVELDVFTALLDGPHTADMVAERVDADGEALGCLLDALVALELLEHRQTGYVLTPFAREHLVAGSARYEGLFPRVFAGDWALWGGLTRRIRRGRPSRRRDVFRGDRERAMLLTRALKQDARALAPKLADRVEDAGHRLDDYDRVLDMGGGHGVYAVVFCRRAPALHATVFDLPAPLAVARETVDAADLHDRITLTEGDFRRDPLPGGHDLALLSHVLHSPGPRAARRLLAGIHDALAPRGRIIVQDVLMDDDRAHPAWGAVFAVNLLLHTARGGCRTRTELCEWLGTAGFVNVVPLDDGILTARKE